MLGARPRLSSSRADGCTTPSRRADCIFVELLSTTKSGAMAPSDSRIMVRHVAAQPARRACARTRQTARHAFCSAGPHGPTSRACVRPRRGGAHGPGRSRLRQLHGRPSFEFRPVVQGRRGLRGGHRRQLLRESGGQCSRRGSIRGGRSQRRLPPSALPLQLQLRGCSRVLQRRHVRPRRAMPRLCRD